MFISNLLIEKKILDFKLCCKHINKEGKTTLKPLFFILHSWKVPSVNLLYLCLVEIKPIHGQFFGILQEHHISLSRTHRSAGGKNMLHIYPGNLTVYLKVQHTKFLSNFTQDHNINLLTKRAKSAKTF